ncbi:MAG: hypothetical protein JNM18_18600 [Planctomycetaceae bacterium]|nr:hypothetical protein [Planctomycetaceae bacterium]
MLDIDLGVGELPQSTKLVEQELMVQLPKNFSAARGDFPRSRVLLAHDGGQNGASSGNQLSFGGHTLGKRVAIELLDQPGNLVVRWNVVRGQEQTREDNQTASQGTVEISVHKRLKGLNVANSGVCDSTLSAVYLPCGLATTAESTSEVVARSEIVVGLTSLASLAKGLFLRRNPRLARDPG